MKLFIKLTFFFILLFAAQPVTSVFADSKSDYEYQYRQYRQNYLEYTILKKDYLENPSLDNQQKAILAAKDTLQSRDLAKYHYAAYLISLIKEKNSGYSQIGPFIDKLENAKNFYRAEATKSQSIVIPADLKAFSQSYAENAIEPDRSFRNGVIAVKVAHLVRFQIELKNGLDIILPKLATPFSTPLNTRIEDLKIQGTKINDSLDAFTNKLLSEEVSQNIDSESYFGDKSEILKNIRNQQLKWIDGLIDIDINYAHS